MQPDQLPKFCMTIAGLSASAMSFIPVFDPSTEGILAYAPDATKEQLDAAVRAACEAQPMWAQVPWSRKQEHLVSMAKALADNLEDLSYILTREQGKPLARARSEISAAMYWFTEIAKMELPARVILDTAESFVAVERVPVGVIGAIVPWNFPVLLAVWKIAPALLAGNTMVLKPSPFTPLTALRIGELMSGVLPAGVLNVISGGHELGPLMTEHPGFGKISFTGSTETGRRVMRSASASLKRLTLELGGNDAAIVMPDVDVESVAKQLFTGAVGNSGQTCIAAKRLYIHRSVYDDMAAALVKLAGSARVGSGLNANVEFGPIQNKPQYDRLKDLLDDCKKNSYNILCGGELPPGPGFFFPITFIDNPPESARVVQEEAFGPIVPLLVFDDADDVIDRANASEYGLAASVWASDTQLAMRIARKLQVGTVWINEIQTASPLKPLGGHKQSGVGVENGIEGLSEYTVGRTISAKLL